MTNDANSARVKPPPVKSTVRGTVGRPHAPGTLANPSQPGPGGRETHRRVTVRQSRAPAHRRLSIRARGKAWHPPHGLRRPERARRRPASSAPRGRQGRARHPLQDSPLARRGRHGRRVPGRAHRHRTQGRHEDLAASISAIKSASPRSSATRPVPPAASARRTSSRFTDFGELKDGRLFFCMELLDGVDLVPETEDVFVEPGRLIGLLRQMCKGTPRRAPGGDRSPRHQAGEHHRRRSQRSTRHGEARRLRHRGDARQQRRRGAGHRRHAPLHGARTDHGRCVRRTARHVRPRVHGLRATRRPPPLRRRRDRGPAAHAGCKTSPCRCVSSSPTATSRRRSRRW